MSVGIDTFDWVRTIVRRRSANVLEAGKEYLVEARITPLAKEAGFESVDAFVGHLRLDEGSADHEAHVRRIVEALTTNETSFFRDVHPFETLKTSVLPEMIRAREATRTLRIWCAAASTGQEPYSIAMLLQEHFPQVSSSWDVRIFATDIHRTVLERARTGVFRQIEVNRGLPARLLVKHFDKVGLDWQLRPEIRKMVSFQELNLLDRWPLFGAQDIVFMRNVLIYFDIATKKQILRRVRDHLAPDGALFLGGAETTLNIDEDLVSERTNGPTLVYRLRQRPAARTATG